MHLKSSLSGAEISNLTSLANTGRTFLEQVTFCPGMKQASLYSCPLSALSLKSETVSPPPSISAHPAMGQGPVASLKKVSQSLACY